MDKAESKNSSLGQASSKLDLLESNLDQSSKDETKISLLERRLELVEDLWQTVLRSECPSDQAERLLRLKKFSHIKSFDREGKNIQVNEIALLIKQMDLAEAISAARAFSLYFQLVNILEQRIEEDSYLESVTNSQDQCNINAFDPFAPPLASQTAPATFQELFQRLRRLNVPPAQLEGLLREMDIRLVFTAHPTEIVRHTVRHKQRKVASLLQQLQSESVKSISERESVRLQLEEEIRLWWRTDELHQFKPTVLDEVDYALHYFQQVLFEAMPLQLIKDHNQLSNHKYVFLNDQAHRVA